MNFDLSDEQELIRATAREFADREIVPRAKENARNEHFDLELVAMLAQQGYLGAIVPREYGGAGLDNVTYGLVLEEIGRGDSAMRTVISVQTSLVCGSILAWGTDEQKATYLPRLCSGEWLGCFGLTEPEAGSDAASQRTRATKVDGGWELHGSKMWISLANHAKVALIFAQTDPDLRHKGLACFLVDANAPGFTTQPIHHKMGLHGSDTGSIALDGVFVADDARLGTVGDGFKIAMSALDSGRYSVAAGCVGICQGCVEESVRYAQEREQFGRPIASFQLVQAMLAEMRVRTDAARLLVWRAGALRDRGKPCTTETSIAKLFATEAAVWCANEAIQVHGGAGYVDDHPVERWFRDVRVTTLYEGTSQIQKLIIGRALTGINALVPDSRIGGPERSIPMTKPTARLPPFQRFLDAHREDVLRFLVASVGRHDADDAFQETFLSALRAYPRLRADSNLRAWVLTIAHRKAIDVHRARGRNPVPVAEIHDGAQRPSPPAAEDTATDHWERVRALPTRQREVLTLRFAADLSHAEIATALGCTEEAARRAAADGLRNLRKEIADVAATA